MGTPQELKLSTAYKTVRRKFYKSIFQWFADDTVNEEVSKFNCALHLYTFRILYLNLCRKQTSICQEYYEQMHKNGK